MPPARALPDVRGRVVMDTSGLKAAEAQAKQSGANIGTGLGAASKGAKAAEQDIASLEKRMGAAGISTGRWTTLLGGGAGLSPALLGAGIAAGALVVAGKSIIEISEQWEAAQKGLAQATDSINGSYEGAQREVDAFIKTNTRFISSQSDVVDSYAALLRQGLGTTKAQDDLNLALDLSILKHIALKDATTLLQQAEMGRGRALLPLGIQMKEFPVLAESQHQADVKLEAATKAVEKAQIAHTAAVKAHGAHSAQAKASAQALAAANAKLAEAQGYATERAKAQAAVHDLLHQKLDGGRKATTDLKQAQNELGNSWQDLAHRAGPPLLSFLALLTSAFADFVKTISDTIGNIAALVSAGVRGAAALGQAGASATAGVQARPGTAAAGFGRAAGGPVIPGQIYSIGEAGPETLVMGPGGTGGMILPNRGGRNPSGGGVQILPIVYPPLSPALQRAMDVDLRDRLLRLDNSQR